MKTSDIRSAFLDFFAKNGHEIVPSSSLVPHNDPTLMFTAAGMVQFKNVFTGAEKRKYVRATTSQKCVRAGGKHNDLDNVGYTARHHTFFEMLGNFSFGDYFKERAIELAWKLLTDKSEGFGISPDRLCVTVYHTDDEAFNIWKTLTSFPDEKIIRIASSDNFWAAGDTGPCGPCSEIFYDHGAHIPGGPPGSPDADGDRFVEIWNLVFMQYEQVDKDTRTNLPKPSIDTGCGLERLAAVLQGVTDNYDIDLFRQLIADITAAASLSGAKNQVLNTHTPSVAYRVIADHLRSCCFLLADGVMPSNEGRGYVLRRIMRRAMRYAHQLGCTSSLMYKLVPSLIREMGEAYPELVRAQALMTEILRLEEERFKQTLERGLKLLEEETEKLTGKSLPGDVAFKLYDTFGFPLDLTQDILRGQGKTVDTDGFTAAMAEQKARARAAWSGSGDKATSRIWFDIKEKVGATEFLGYDQHDAAAQLVAIVVNGEEVAHAAAGSEALLIFNQTPFYGESGGQAGDHGMALVGQTVAAEITDTLKPLDGFHVHKATLRAPLKVGDAVTLAIDVERRDRVRANHSATHLLHAALRRHLGEHITQKGSLVAPDKLRFDVSHPKAITREELAAVEQEVNRIIWQNSEATTRLMTPDEAVKQGAMALFGEKYGDEVRVLALGKQEGGEMDETPYSVELCGGTHVHATGDIGLFKILSESAVAAGIRRIEAVTRDSALAYLSEQDSRVRDLAGQVKATPAELNDKIALLMNERKKLEKELAEAKKVIAMGSSSGSATQEAEQVGNFTFLVKQFDDLDPKELRSVAEGFLKSADVVVVTTQPGGKASIVVAVRKEAAANVSAVDLVKAAVAAVGGNGGGGRPEMAQGGGPEADKLEDAIAAIRAMLAH
jgi:alanyl-tRNA synthetase